MKKEQWERELIAEMRFKNMTKKEAEESLWKKYMQQRRQKLIEGYLTEFTPPRTFTGNRKWSPDGSIRRSITSTLKNWWSIIKGE